MDDDGDQRVKREREKGIVLDCRVMESTIGQMTLAVRVPCTHHYIVLVFSLLLLLLLLLIDCDDMNDSLSV